MKRSAILFFSVTIGLLGTNPGLSQIRNPLKKIEKKSVEKIEDGIGSLFNKNKKNTEEEKEVQTKETVPEVDGSVQKPANTSTDTPSVSKEKPTLSWAKYDFVPGDKIIFEDNLVGEENGEFPSRWDLYDGTTENAVFGGENVIMFRGGRPSIIPYLKNSDTDYLPDVFTIEFDLYLPSNDFTVYFFDQKNQLTPTSHDYLNISGEQMSMNPASSQLPNNGTIRKRWAHIAIAFTSGKMKAYIDETRLINIPRLDFEPIGITLLASSANDNNLFYMKNFRIAEGGVKYYDRFLQDGKIVSNGIRFDIGKATLRPESMGVLNGIYSLLSEHPEVKFSIEGHTDSDGETDSNLILSEERAKTVMDQLVSMGIDADRVTSRGFGESKPVDTNGTPEGKAANRRVEFVKK